MPVWVDVRDDQIGGEVVDTVFAWLRRVDRLFSTYDAGSQISALNAGRLSLGDADPVVREVVDRCEELRTETDGRFDARAAGAGRIDPSGFVKGWAVDRAVALLEAQGARNLCVNAGGDVCVRGEPARGSAWRVGIRHPGRADRVAAVLRLNDAAVATSATYERGEHIIDPRTGRPPAGVRSVSVLGRELGRADAYATAAFAMGQEGPEWTATLRGYDAMTVLEGDRVLFTGGFARRRAARWRGGRAQPGRD
jgi:thiamine biosynthesis lipoprotein